jgi:hypothetical protein
MGNWGDYLELGISAQSPLHISMKTRFFIDICIDLAPQTLELR